jgi:hypothetical protein
MGHNLHSLSSNVSIAGGKTPVSLGCKRSAWDLAHPLNTFGEQHPGPEGAKTVAPSCPVDDLNQGPGGVKLFGEPYVRDWGCTTTSSTTG